MKRRYKQMVMALVAIIDWAKAKIDNLIALIGMQLLALYI